MVERIHPSLREEREAWIRGVDYNLFALRGSQVYIDLLTDSGTGAMSDCQWAALMRGDETYAGSKSFDRLEDQVKKVFGFDHVLPVHQGRAAEHVLFTTLVKEGDIVPANSHFDTTRAHIESRRAHAVDCPINEAACIDSCHPFKGNVDLGKLQNLLADKHDQIPFIIMTLTCNKSGGQPVSLDNIHHVKQLADKYGISVVFDSARFAENAWFIQQREEGYKDKPIKDIVREMHAYADAMMMSAKKDGLVNIGGILATRHRKWFDDASKFVILYEGFKTYGGLAGRDLDALAVGLDEVTDVDYLRCRIGQVHRLGQMLIDAGIPVQQPIGGHAIVIDASTFLPNVPKEEYPAQKLGVELYIEGGVRGVELGTILNGRDPTTQMERYAEVDFLRLAIPRRVYTNDHLFTVGQALINVYGRRASITRGFRIVEETETLRHFTVRLRQADESTDSHDVVCNL